MGILAVGPLMAALRRRRRTGKGAFVDLSQREATVAMMGDAVLDYSLNGRVARPVGNRDPLMAPQGIYPCHGDDMWVAISVDSDDAWGGLSRAMGRPELAQDARFETALARRQNHEHLDQIISTWTGERDHHPVMQLLQAQGVTAGAVLKGGEIIEDTHLEARGFWDTVDHPEVGPYKQVSTPWQLSRSSRQHATPAPGLGEHNGFVLGDLLGLADAEISDLQHQGIIGTEPTGLE